MDCNRLATTPEPVLMSNRTAVPAGIPTATSPLLVCADTHTCITAKPISSLYVLTKI